MTLMVMKYTMPQQEATQSILCLMFTMLLFIQLSLLMLTIYLLPLLMQLMHPNLCQVPMNGTEPHLPAVKAHLDIQQQLQMVPNSLWLQLMAHQQILFLNSNKA